MKIEETPLASVDNAVIDEVLLSDGEWYPCEVGSFGIHSPVEADPRRAGQRPGAFVRFVCTGTHKRIEAPLSSLVAVSYPEEVSDDEAWASLAAQGNSTE